MKKKTQQERILDYIKDFGSITSLEAFRDIGCTRLSGQIYALKKKGYTFDDEIEHSINRYGESSHYKRYYLNRGNTNDERIYKPAQKNP